MNSFSSSNSFAGSFVQMVEVAIHSILYARDIYAHGMFEQRVCNGLMVWKCTSNAVDDYISECMKHIHRLVDRRVLSSLVVDVIPIASSQTTGRETYDASTAPSAPALFGGQYMHPEDPRATWSNRYIFAVSYPSSTSSKRDPAADVRRKTVAFIQRLMDTHRVRTQNREHSDSLTEPTHTWRIWIQCTEEMESTDANPHPEWIPPDVVEQSSVHVQYEPKTHVIRVDSWSGGCVQFLIQDKR